MDNFLFDYYSYSGCTINEEFYISSDCCDSHTGCTINEEFYISSDCCNSHTGCTITEDFYIPSDCCDSCTGHTVNVCVVVDSFRGFLQKDYKVYFNDGLLLTKPNKPVYFKINGKWK